MPMCTTARRRLQTGHCCEQSEGMGQRGFFRIWDLAAMW